jgi:hypothetical protein
LQRRYLLLSPFYVDAKVRSGGFFTLKMARASGGVVHVPGTTSTHSDWLSQAAIFAAGVRQSGPCLRLADKLPLRNPPTSDGAV